MKVVYLHDHDLRRASDATSSAAIRPTLDQTALATGAAERRARAAEIEANIDHACETAALRPELCLSTAKHRDWDRRGWSGRTWDRYVAEAVRQAHPSLACSVAHAAELERLRHEAAQLDRLLQASPSPACRSTAGGLSPP